MVPIVYMLFAFTMVGQKEVITLFTLKITEITSGGSLTTFV